MTMLVQEGASSGEQEPAPIFHRQSACEFCQTSMPCSVLKIGMVIAKLLAQEGCFTSRQQQEFEAICLTLEEVGWGYPSSFQACQEEGKGQLIVQLTYRLIALLKVAEKQ